MLRNAWWINNFVFYPYHLNVVSRGLVFKEWNLHMRFKVGTMVAKEYFAVGSETA